MTEINDLIKKMAEEIWSEQPDDVTVETICGIIERHIEKAVDGKHMNEIADLFGELQ